jgi:hypothetical protein
MPLAVIGPPRMPSHIERTEHPGPLSDVSADQRRSVARDRIELVTFRFSGQPRQALCRPAKADVTGKRTALGGKCRIKANRGRCAQSRQAGRGIQQSRQSSSGGRERLRACRFALPLVVPAEAPWATLTNGSSVGRSRYSRTDRRRSMGSPCAWPRNAPPVAMTWPSCSNANGSPVTLASR